MTALVVTGGHPFEEAAFAAVFDEMGGVEWEHLPHPDAYARLDEGVAPGDVVVFYDMPGVEFTRADPPVRLPEPPAEVVDLFASLTTQGVPLLFLHHAIAGWPAWDGYADLLGGRFHYAPASFDGVELPASGYRFDVTYDVDVVDTDHPVTAGLGPGFLLTDELYWFPARDAAVTPLLRRRGPFVDEHFYSADLAIRGERDSNAGWSHPWSTDLVGWTHEFAASTVVYLQFGDGPETYADPSYRRVLHNAIAWLSADDLSRG